MKEDNFPLILAFALFTLGVLLSVATAVFSVIERGDWIPMIITVVLLSLGALVLTPLIRQCARLMRDSKTAASDKEKQNEHF
jgi:hypothetical protein